MPCQSTRYQRRNNGSPFPSCHRHTRGERKKERDLDCNSGSGEEQKGSAGGAAAPGGGSDQQLMLVDQCPQLIVIFSMASDVPIDNEAIVVTSSIYLEIYQLSLSVSVLIVVQYVYAFILHRVNICTCLSALHCTMLCKKKTSKS